jgi:selenobiotic family peptide radical SAM maturase
MLTLTKDNLGQVLPLAEKLKDVSDYFTFNRLSNVGEGKNLLLPGKEEYAEFLKEYVKASEDNPIMGFKDNLINIALEEELSKPFGGCTGYGCGAAFSFVTILPDGEVHACRKFPSEIGNILKSSLLDIYNSKKASRYRLGSEACSKCSLKPYCGGCLAITSGQGEDIFRNKDPYCFK